MDDLAPTGRELPAQRRRQMARFLRTHPDDAVDLRSLAARFQVSEQTVRRDLAALERDGVVERTFGGAIVREAAERGEPTFHARESRQHAAKAELAAAALDQLTPGEGLFLDASSTVLHLARRLPASWSGDATTAGVPAFMELASRPELRLTALGGEYHRSSNCLRGQVVLEQLARLRFDTAVISARTVHPRFGLCEADADEAALKRLVLAVSARVLVLVDHTKLQRTSAHHYADLEQVDLVLTDAAADPGLIEALQAVSPTPIVRGQPRAAAADSDG